MKKLSGWLTGITLLAAALNVPAVGPVYSLGVDGLACLFCAYGIEKKLSALEGVKGISVDLKAGRVIVSMEEGASLDESTAREQVEATGFTLRGFALVGKEE